VRCLRARPCGFRLLCFLPVACFSTGPLLRSHLVRPHVTVWALLVFARVVAAWACCGRVCSVGGWVGCLRYCPCSCGCLRFWCWRACLGVVGQCGPAALPRLACLRVHALVWACWRVRGSALAPLRAGCNSMGRDNVVPPHTAWRAVPGCCVARGERRGVWGARRVLTRARTHAERGIDGRERGSLVWVDSGGLAGGGGAGIPCWRAVPTRGRAKLTLLGRGRGALPAVACGFGSGGAWWLGGCAFGGGGSSFGCVGDAGGVALSPWWWVWVGGGGFPLVVGLGWWWRFPLGGGFGLVVAVSPW